MSKKEITIKSVDREDDYGIIVEFSNGTTAGYVVEELLALRPHREETIEKPVITMRPC